MSGRRRPRTQKRRAGQPRTLRTRLVVASVVLIAVVCAVIGTVTTLALRSHLYEQLDGQLNEVAARASGSFRPPDQPKDTEAPDQGRKPKAVVLKDFVAKGPQPSGTIAAKVQNGSVTEAQIGKKTTDDNGVPQMKPESLSEAATQAVGSVAQDTKKHTVDIPGYGEYRVQYATGPNGTFYVAIPTTDVDNTLNTLILIEASVTAAALVAAGIAGTVIVGVATRPLRRVAVTATRVSNSPSTPARSTSANASPRPRPTRTPRSARSAPRSTGCWTTSTPPCTPASRARCGCGSSWPTPAMS